MYVPGGGWLTVCGRGLGLIFLDLHVQMCVWVLLDRLSAVCSQSSSMNTLPALIRSCVGDTDAYGGKQASSGLYDGQTAYSQSPGVLEQPSYLLQNCTRSL